MTQIRLIFADFSQVYLRKSAFISVHLRSIQKVQGSDFWCGSKTCDLNHTAFLHFCGIIHNYSANKK
jgi:hypothetical protein